MAFEWTWKRSIAFLSLPLHQCAYPRLKQGSQPSGLYWGDFFMDDAACHFESTDYLCAICLLCQLVQTHELNTKRKRLFIRRFCCIRVFGTKG